MAVQYYTTAPTADDDDDFNLVNTMLESVTHTIVALEHYTFPTVCAVLMATSLHGNNSNSNNETTTLSSESSVIMAAIVASSSCYDSIVSGLWAGYLVISWSDRCLYAAICNNLPATMTSLLCGGGLGGVIAIFVLPVAQILRFATASFRHLLSTLIMTRPWGMWLAFGLGCLSCYGSKVGWYHSVHLPLILIEMEMGNASFLGAIDELTLVLVCAGVCAAILFPSIRQRDISEQADVFLCRRGLGVNICCGDFVEVCYPYMEKSIIVSVGGYLASGSACAWLVWRGNQTDALPESMAYLPWPVAVGLASEHSLAMLESSMVAFLLAFAFAMLR